MHNPTSALLYERITRYAQVYWNDGDAMPPTLMLLLGDGSSVTTDVSRLLFVTGGKETLLWVPAYFSLLSGGLAGCALSYESHSELIPGVAGSLVLSVNMEGQEEDVLLCALERLESGKRFARAPKTLTGTPQVFSVSSDCVSNLRALAIASCESLGRAFTGKLTVGELHGMASELDRRTGSVFHLTALEIAAALYHQHQKQTGTTVAPVVMH
jgi:hypothetical protein